VSPPAPWTTPPPAAPETGAGSGRGAPAPVPPAPTAEPEPPPGQTAGEPGVERVDVRDALRVAQLDDEVLVVDGHPRYHLAGCPLLTGSGPDAEIIPLAVSAARRAGFTPCAVCGPDAALLAGSRERARQKAEYRGPGRPNDEGRQI
jgi:hypothetical protein